MAEERILEKVQKLLNLANHPNTGEAEREAFLAKADKMMFDHAIEQAELDALKSPEERRRPVVLNLTLFDPYSWYRPMFRTILADLGRANRVRVALNSDGSGTLVGFADDVAWTEMLWLSIFREFVAKIQPSWDSNAGIDYNVKALKEAGNKWLDIWYALRRDCDAKGVDVPCPAPPKDGGWLIRAYKRECKRVGQTEMLTTQKHDAYKWSFGNGFTNRICTRLRDQMETHSESQALVVSMGDINAEFYNLFPDMDPARQAAREADLREQARRDEEAEAAMVAAMTPAARAKYLEKKEAEKRKQARSDESYWRRQERLQMQYHDSDGRRAGRRAADAVDLNRHVNVADDRKGQIGG